MEQLVPPDPLVQQELQVQPALQELFKNTMHMEQQEDLL